MAVFVSRCALMIRTGKLGIAVNLEQNCVFDADLIEGHCEDRRDETIH